MFAAAAIPGWPRYYVARDSDNRPAILIEPVDNIPLRLRADIDLRHVSYLARANCEVKTRTGITTSLLCVLRCMSSHPDLCRLFLHVMDSWIVAVGKDPQQDQVSSGVDRLVELFHGLGSPTVEEVKGMWGELAIIAASNDPKVLLTAWHLRPREVHDFAAGNHRIEVKTSSGIHVHSFSLHQLTPPANCVLVVASMLLAEQVDGASILDLTAMIKNRVELPGLRLRLDEVVASTLGQDWLRASSVRFSRERALESLRWYDGSRLPRIRAEHVPPEVSEVRFRVDLSSVAPEEGSVLAGHGGLIHAALPA